jgi:hypothetical protein
MHSSVLLIDCIAVIKDVLTKNLKLCLLSKLIEFQWRNKATVILADYRKYCISNVIDHLTAFVQR